MDLSDIIAGLAAGGQGYFQGRSYAEQINETRRQQAWQNAMAVQQLMMQQQATQQDIAASQAGMQVNAADLLLRQQQGVREQQRWEVGELPQAQLTGAIAKEQLPKAPTLAVEPVEQALTTIATAQKERRLLPMIEAAETVEWRNREQVAKFAEDYGLPQLEVQGRVATELANTEQNVTRYLLSDADRELAEKEQIAKGLELDLNVKNLLSTLTNNQQLQLAFHLSQKTPPDQILDDAVREAYMLAQPLLEANLPFSTTVNVGGFNLPIVGRYDKLQQIGEIARLGAQTEQIGAETEALPVRLGLEAARVMIDQGELGLRAKALDLETKQFDSAEEARRFSEDMVVSNLLTYPNALENPMGFRTALDTALARKLISPQSYNKGYLLTGVTHWPTLAKHLKRIAELSTPLKGTAGTERQQAALRAILGEQPGKKGLMPPLGGSQVVPME